ncbi:TetR/AcrR family transcriptional regulator [Leptospira sp. 96542]|nr:TetR/AcrR family transcriptional regulator [Leptospira sp. 96542]
MKDEAMSTKEQILNSAQTIINGKGFSAVGLKEILTAANVPKGSFYHYFPSKENFGECLLQRYFTNYLEDIDLSLQNPNLTGADLVLGYFKRWQSRQLAKDSENNCLAVKLAAEVSDLSEPMRLALDAGTKGIIKRLGQMIQRGMRDGTVKSEETPEVLAERLYQLWLGASLLMKISKESAPLKKAMESTLQTLGMENQTSKK